MSDNTEDANADGGQTCTPQTLLPYRSGTLAQFREQIARHAYLGEQRFGELVELMVEPGRKLTDAEVAEMRIAHHAAQYGWATVALLGRIAEQWGAQQAYLAAAMVEDMAVNGGAPYSKDVSYPPITQAAATGAGAVSGG